MKNLLSEVARPQTLGPWKQGTRLFDQDDACDDNCDQQNGEDEYAGRAESLFALKPQKLRAVSVKAARHATTSRNPQADFLLRL